MSNQQENIREAIEKAQARASELAAKMEGGQQGTKRSRDEEVHNNNGGGGGGARQDKRFRNNSEDPAHIETIEHMVPNSVVGLVIGKGGEQINRIQAETGCRVQMATESRGGPERPCSITGTPAAVQRCREMIEQIIMSRQGLDNQRYAGPQQPVAAARAPAPRGSGAPPGHITVEMILPPRRAGLLIGKGGETIKSIQNEAGVSLLIVQDSNSDPNEEKPLRITGPPENCEHAQRLVTEFLNSKGGWEPPGNGRMEVSYTVHSSKCGLLIGKGGETVRTFGQRSGARIEILKIAPPEDPTGKTFVIRGTPEQIETARQLFVEKIGELPPPNAQTPTTGAYFATSAQQQVAAATQWGAYHWPAMSLQAQVSQPQAMITYAMAPQAAQHGGATAVSYYPYYGYTQAQLQQSAAAAVATQYYTQPQQVAATQAASSAAAQADYTTAWINYYMSIGKVKEAEELQKQHPSLLQQQALVAAAAQQQQPNYQQWVQFYRSQGMLKEAEQWENWAKIQAAAQ
ncbi:FUBP3 [Cordylochernes scorpioides]|uniref:FUBP3 n=1 Tax=Cordylochernes scorpioides TaxID=51811 RepID=A0ABY6KJK8_9ARAC|nr:FUBP3 [Cordylochernes scorpioides]